MDKSHTEILLSCKEEILQLKARLEALEERIAQLEADNMDDEVDFTSIEIGIEEAPPETPEEAAPYFDLQDPQEPVDVELDMADYPSPPPPQPEPEPEPVPEPAFDPVPESLPEPAPQPEDPTARLPWRTDRPGIPVKNIRSGISLLDRAMFIGQLFKEDAALYDATLADLNQMQNLNEAVAYLQERFPDWDLSSNPVYHFMMSLRKKLG